MPVPSAIFRVWDLGGSTNVAFVVLELLHRGVALCRKAPLLLLEIVEGLQLGPNSISAGNDKRSQLNNLFGSAF